MKQPQAIEYIIADNLRTARIEKAMTLNAAARLVGITYQQLQKYENGKNRISAGRLWQLSRVYGWPIESFFD